jgi:hypothetical protein
MKLKLKKILCLSLVLALTVPFFTGCVEEEEPLPVIIPEQQIFNDKYERNSEITDNLTYKYDYITTKSTYNNGNMEVLALFNHMKVQVDSWDCITVGSTTMGELIATIDKANENYVKTKTDAVIAERQAAIDKEYEEAKAKAEAKGKTYDKPKKEARTDDIYFEAPYTYTVTVGTNNKAVPGEYKPTLLVDPSKNKAMLIIVSKYGIPYVGFDFYSVNDLYNTKITQESDWILNGIGAAYVGDMVDETTGTAPDYVDADGRNKAAKQNIYMSGNIAFGGEGFTWESLMILCDALQLVEGNRVHGFKQSSDENFTYYTIQLCANPFELLKDGESYGDFVAVPVIQLIATFDPLSQVCLNWTLSTFSTPLKYNKRNHELSDPTDVNIHQYQVDTNNYEGMRNTIQKWIEENSASKKTVYYAFDKDGKVFGTVNTGIKNVTIEPIINGENYICVSYDERLGGSVEGKYIKVTDMTHAESLEDPTQAQEYIDKNTHTLIIRCCALNDKDEILGYVEDDMKTLYDTKDGIVYHIAQSNKTSNGYQDVLVLTEENVSQLIMLYTKTYKLDADQNIELQSIANEKGIPALKEHIDEMFAEAEAEQNNNATKDDNEPCDSETVDQESTCDTQVTAVTLFNNQVL